MCVIQAHSFYIHCECYVDWFMLNNYYAQPSINSVQIPILYISTFCLFIKYNFTFILFNINIELLFYNSTEARLQECWIRQECYLSLNVSVNELRCMLINALDS